MESCCILGCDSYREAATKSIGYFKFPLNDGTLLCKWLQQINRAEWTPLEHNQICSAHFRTDDLDYQRYRKQPLLKPNAVPSLFPAMEMEATVQEAKPKQRRNKKQLVVDPRAIILRRQRAAVSVKQLRGNIQSEAKNWLNPQSVSKKPNLTKRSTGKTKSRIELIPVTHARLQTMLPKANGLISQPDLQAKKPFPRITLHEECQKAETLTNAECFETVYLPNYSEDEMDFEEVKFESDSLQSRLDVCDSQKESQSENSLSVDPIILKLPRVEDRLAEKSKQVPASQTKDRDTVPEVTYAKVGNVIRDHVYSFPSALQLQYSYSKAQIDCDKLRKRLKMLRQQHKREQEKVKKLQWHLADLGNKIRKNLNADSVKSKSTRRSRAKLGNCEDEYEKLLREVRKLKRNHVVDNTNFVEPRSLSPHETAGCKSKNEDVTEETRETHGVHDDGEIIGEIEEDCGEIIGEIDDCSMEKDLGAENRWLDSNKEFLNPGLIEG